MARLQGCILTVIREPQKLPLRLGNAAARFVHPFQGAGDQQGCCRASPFAGQTRQLAALTHPLRRFVMAAQAERELSRDEPEIVSARSVATISTDDVGHRHTLLPIPSQPFNAVFLFSPAFGVTLKLACELEVSIARRNRTEIPRDFVFFSVERRVVDASGQKAQAPIIVDLGHDMVFLATISAEPRGVEAVSRGFGVLELPFKKDPTRPGRERRKDFTGTGDEPVEFEGEKGSVLRAAALMLRQAHPGQKFFEIVSAGFGIDRTGQRKLFNGFFERDRLLPAKLEPIVQSEFEFGPHRERMALQGFVIECVRQRLREGRLQSAKDVLGLQGVIGRALQ